MHHVRTIARAAALALAAAPALALAAPASASTHAGTLYSETNAASGNEIAVYARATDGTLAPIARYDAGGAGLGAGLGSEGAVVLSRKLLFAVDAGSDQITTFVVRGTTLVHRSVVWSGGDQPISLTVNGSRLYVLNAGTEAGVSGFDIGLDGALTPIADSTRPLSAGAAGPAEVAFAPDGSALVVTEKASGTIDTFPVDGSGVAGAAISHPSTGDTPFGFAVDKAGHVIVSNAGPGHVGSSSLSSYAVDGLGGLTPITSSAPDLQSAACWVALSPSERFAYTTNAASDSISTYAVRSDGSVSVQGSPASLSAGAHPTDIATVRGDGGAYVYAVNSLLGTISALQADSHGALTPIGVGSFGSLPLTMAGLAVR